MPTPKTTTLKLRHTNRAAQNLPPEDLKNALKIASLWREIRHKVHFNRRNKEKRKYHFNILCLGADRGISAILVELFSRELTNIDFSSVGFLCLDSDEQAIDQAKDIYTTKRCSNIKYAVCDYTSPEPVKSALKKHLNTTNVDLILFFMPKIHRDSLSFYMPWANRQRVINTERCISTVVPVTLAPGGTMITTMSHADEDKRFFDMVRMQARFTQQAIYEQGSDEYWFNPHPHSILRVYSDCNVIAPHLKRRPLHAAPMDKEAFWGVGRATLFVSSAVAIAAGAAFLATQLYQKDEEPVAGQAIQM